MPSPLPPHTRSLSAPGRFAVLAGTTCLALACLNPASAAWVLDAPADLEAVLQPAIESVGSDTPTDEAAAAQAARRLRQVLLGVLATEGYFRPEIRIGEPQQGDRKVDVRPGPQTRVSEVRIDFRGEVAESSWLARQTALRNAWRLAAGQPFRQADWDRAKQNLLQALAARDFPSATLADSRAEIDPASDQARLSITYDSGPAFTLGELQISGLEQRSPDFVRRLSPLQPGEPYDQERLLSLQSSLQNTPYFSSVLVDVEPNPEHPQRLPVRIQLRESRSKRLTLGGGYSTNTGYRAEASFRHTNLLDRGWALSSGLRWTQRQQLAYADVHLPAAQAQWRNSFGALAENSDIQGLVTRRQAIAAVRTKARDNMEYRVSLKYTREHVDIHDTTPDSYLRRALALSWALTYRAVDNPADPRDGYVAYLSIGGGARALASDQNFLRTHLRYQHYWPVGAGDVFSLRGEAGLTATPSRFDVPQEFLFRAGGAQSVRGYAYQGLGVREDGATTGGRLLALGSAEYTRWFATRSAGGQWGAAVFYDLGNAADNWSRYRAVAGYGLGARWKSPAGPLALDLAYGHADKRLRLHFSVAITF